MKDSEIYLRAAKLVSSGVDTWASCSAVSEIACGFHVRKTPQSEKYAELFSPKIPTFAWGEQWSNDLEERNNCRVLALLFMHQIALDEERSKK